MASKTSYTLDYAPAKRHVSWRAFIAIGVIFVAHGALQFELYRSRVVNQWSLADSDLFVFGCPNLLAISSYAVVFSKMARKQDWVFQNRLLFVTTLTLTAGFFSFWAGMVVALYTYGS